MKDKKKDSDVGGTEFSALTDTIAPAVSAAYSSQSGLVVYLEFTEVDSPPLLPATGNIPGFTISNGGSAIVVGSASRKGASGLDAKTIVLNLSSRLTPLAAVTVSYTAGSPALKDSANNSVVSFTAFSVVNYTSRPVFSSAQTNLGGTYVDVVLTDYDSPSILPAGSHSITWWAVKEGGVSRTLTSAARKGATGDDAKIIRLTLAAALSPNSTVTLDYVPGGITDNSVTPNPMLGFVAKTVANNTVETIPPTFSNAATNTAGTTVIVNLTENDSAPILPSTGSIPGFTLTENGVARVVSSAVKSGAKQVSLTMGAALNTGTTLLLSYTPVSSSPYKLTDSATVPNAMLAFSGQTVANNTVERIPPTVVSLTLDSATQLTITMSEACSPSSPNGFVIVKDGASLGALTVTQPTTTTYRFVWSTAVNCENILYIGYAAPVSNRVTDLAGNPLDNFYNRLVPNNLTDNIGPFNPVASTSDSGKYIDVLFTENRTPPLTPDSSMNADGFLVHVNKEARVVLSAKRLGNTGAAAKTIRIMLIDPIRAGDSVALVYVQGGTNPVKDSAGNLAAAFSINVANNALNDPLPFFNPIAWAISPVVDPGAADLFERRWGYPLASLVLDTTPPQGDVVLNENPNTNGIAIHHFAAFSPTDTESSGSTSGDYILDNAYAGIAFKSAGAQAIQHVEFKLKSTGSISNTAERLFIYLYSSSATGEPGTRIATSSSTITFSTIGASYSAFKVPMEAALEEGQTYWIILYRPTAPSGGGVDALVYTDDEDGLVARKTESGTWVLLRGITGYYKLYAEAAGATPLPGFTQTEDALGRGIREATNFGGASDESDFEIIGVGDKRTVTKCLDLDNNGEWPQVTSVSVGATATKGKAYIVEALPVGSTVWEPLFYSVANDSTRKFRKWTFSSSPRLQAVRVRYRGDFYAASNDGNLTVSALDSLTGVEAVMMSRYADFRDAVDVPGADSLGWVPFTDGTSVVEWSLVNASKTWLAESGLAATALLHSIQFGAGLVASSAHRLYKLIPGGTLISAYAAPAGVTIQALKVYQGKLYAGLSNGSLLVTSSGDSYTVVPGPALPAVLSLESYRGRLWIGTASGGSGNAEVHAFDGVDIVLVRDDLNYPQVSSMVSARGYLFLGFGGVTGTRAAAIYRFDGATWSLNFDSSDDAVEIMGYSTATSKVYAGIRGGALWELAFDSANAPQAWSKAYDVDADHFYSFVDDPNGEYFFLASDNGLSVYIKTLDAYAPVGPPTPLAAGLQSVWTNVGSDQYTIIGAGYSRFAFNDPQINYSGGARPTGLNDNRINAVWEGFIKGSTTEAYTFYVDVNDGARVWVGGQLIIDSWQDQTSLTAASGVAGLIQDAWTSIRVEYYRGAADALSGIKLSWSYSSQAKTLVPSASLRSPTAIHDISFVGNTPYGVIGDGRVMALDISSVATKKRTAYVRFRDLAGNVTPMPGITDVVLQDQEKQSGTKVSAGRIYQIGLDKSVVATFSSKIASAVSSPDRRVSQFGTYETEPYHAPTLTRWNTIGFIATVDAGATQSPGLDRGVEVALYVRTGDTREQCLESAWGAPFVLTTINHPENVSNSGMAQTFSIASLQQKWLQYKVVLSSASRSLTPSLQSVTLGYQASQSSYFFTKIFGLDDEVGEGSEFRRGILTYNAIANGGQITFGYTLDDTPGNTFDFSRYQHVEDGKVFEIPSGVPASKIRWAIQLVSINSSFPAQVDEFAIQLDAGGVDPHWMD